MPASDSGASGLAPYAAFAGCSTIWGSTFLFISLGNDAVPPLWAATLRLGLASVLLSALMLLTRRPFPRGEALRAAAGFGFFNFGLSLSLLYWGETIVPSGLTSVIYATIPISTALFAWGLGLERPTALKLGGALVALGGVAIIFSGEITGRLPALPLAAVLFAATCAALSGVVLKRGPRQSPVGANAVGALVGFAVCLVASLLAGEPHALPSSPRAVLPILYLTVAGSLVAFGLYAWLVNHWKVTRISFISVVVPLVAVTLGAAFRHERLTAADGMGSLLVMAGLLLAIRSDRREAARRT